MKRVVIFTFVSALFLTVSAQTISFTGQLSDGSYVELDRIRVINHTQGWQGTLFYPDTVLTLDNVSEVADFSHEKELTLWQNTPNPFNGSTEFCLTLTEPEEVHLVLMNVQGLIETVHSISLEAGTHRFRTTTKTQGTHMLTAISRHNKASIVLLCDEGGYTSRIDYYGQTAKPKREQKADLDGLIQVGDEMEYIAYASPYGKEISHRTQQVLDEEQEVIFIYNKEFAEALSSMQPDFRVALSLSPFSLNQFEDGYRFIIGNDTAYTPKQLQQLYRDLGSTEMYVRIATKRHKTADNLVDGKEDENANVHTFDQALELCRIADSLRMPINPEIMGAYTYMDMDKIQAPRFEEYPSIYALQHGKNWEELSLHEICDIMEAYGEFVADSILAICTHVKVTNWNIGNEANFGFAGVGMGQKTAVDSKLGNASDMKRYMAGVFSVWWLKKHVWNYEAQTLAAVKKGVLKAYAKKSLDASDVKFSTHIATVVFTPRACTSFFRYMADNGYAMETAGLSYYPSAPALSINKKQLLTRTVVRINKKCKIPVFIGEFAYPSGKMSGPFAGWNKQLGDYQKTQQGQADIYSDVMSWGKKHGMAGIRYWAPDYEGWYTMAMFEFADKIGEAKIILTNHSNIVKQ
ncbi:MAG: glycosyl hydrolase 53 family protein [Paludibacteraceae bacterium]|nr:glycosyl hydrolase 53 family protein [Paludibacteraceae bacterium]